MGGVILAPITLSGIFGILAVVMMLCARINYLRSVFRGKTRPHAFSWFIWGAISAIGFAAQVVKGAGAGSWARGFGSMTSFFIAVIAFSKGDHDIRRSDWLTFMAALFAILLWIITKTPLWSVVLVCIIDTLGYFPTLRKSWHKPHEETAGSYLFSCLSAFFSLLAVEHYNPSTWLYPAVLVLSNGGTALFLMIRRAKIAPSV